MTSEGNRVVVELVTFGHLLNVKICNINLFTS